MVDRGLVVVGSGPAGLAAAQAFREQDAGTPVTMITADPHPPYARPPLTKDYAQGDSDLDDLWLTEPGSLDEQRIELRLGTPVTAVDTERRQVRLTDGDVVEYAQVVLATGSQPVPIPVPGGDDPDLLYVRDLISGHRLRALAERRDRRVAVIGSGFIGCEAAASLAARGLEVVLVSDETVPHAARLGEEAGREIHRWLAAAGVELVLGVPLARISRGRDGDFVVALEDGCEHRASDVVVATGARPELAVAEQSGLVIENGGVRVDASMRTSSAAVFAVGDIAFAEHDVAGRRLRVEHWGDAEQHGGDRRRGGGRREQTVERTRPASGPPSAIGR